MKKFIICITIILTTSCAATLQEKQAYQNMVNCCIKQNGDFCKKTYSDLIGNNIYAGIALRQCCASGICYKPENGNAKSSNTSAQK